VLREYMFPLVVQILPAPKEGALELFFFLSACLNVGNNKEKKKDEA
jgi:hypothetical protein